MSEATLIRLVESALAQMASGEQVDVEDICADHPDLTAAVRESLALHSQIVSASLEGPASGELLVGRYRIEETIGAGAMGIVFQARDEQLDRLVAIKFLRTGVLDSPVRRERFQREAQILASLQHDHIVSVYDAGQTPNGSDFLVMEFLRGRTLSSVLGTPSGEGEDLAESAITDLRSVVSWMADIAAALQVSHDAGVFHRDLKPSNLFVREDDKPVILDFGIATRADDARLTIQGSALGTPWYMAPEQARGENTALAQTDIYGLCATLYHLAIGRPPYLGDLVEVLRLLESSDPPQPRKLRPDLPRDLEAILEKGLERRVADRYATMAELEADLRAFLAFRPVRARPLSATQRWVRRIRRRPGRAVAAVLVLAAGGLGLWGADRLARGREVSAKQVTEIHAMLPGMLCIESTPGDTAVTELPEREGALATLDRLIDLKPADLQGRLLRASLRLDRGDRAGSDEDLAALQEILPCPLTAAVAEAFRTSPDSVAATKAVDLSGLPEPVGPQQLFLKGFLLLRDRQVRAAHECFVQAGDYLLARDLRLTTSGAFLGGLVKEERHAAARELRQDALRLEGVYGRPTARTQSALGIAHVFLNEYEQASEHLEQSLALRPNRHGPMTNLGISYHRLGRFEEALTTLREAHRLRPWVWNTRYQISLTLIELGRLDEAEATGRFLSEDPRRQVFALYLESQIALARAFSAYQGDDPEAARAEALRARDALRQVSGARFDGDIPRNLAFAELLAHGPNQARIADYIRAAATNPTNVATLRELKGIFDSDHGGGLGDALVVYLESLIQRIQKLPSNRQP